MVGESLRWIILPLQFKKNISEYSQHKGKNLRINQFLYGHYFTKLWRNVMYKNTDNFLETRNEVKLDLH